MVVDKEPKIEKVLDAFLKDFSTSASSYSKWMLASLVSVNGAALIGLSQQAGGLAASPAISVQAFFLGLVFAICCGGCSWVSSLLTTAILARLFIRGIDANSDGTGVIGNAAIIAAFSAVALAIASIISFVTGGVQLLAGSG